MEATEEYGSLNTINAEKLKTWAEIPPADIHDLENIVKIQEKHHETSPFPCDLSLNRKVVLWLGDIVSLNTDAIVNSSNESLNEQNPLSNRILLRAGPQLIDEIRRSIRGCRTGDAKISNGYNLPARHIIHTVGPKYNVKYQTAAEGALFSCYQKVLQVAKENKLSSVALCVINSIRRSYPPEEGAHIALRTVRRFLERHGQGMRLIIFAVENHEIGIYEHLMPLYFPRNDVEEEFALYNLPKDIGNEDGEPVIADRMIRISDNPMQKETFEESVDFAQEFNSSVAIGEHSFAKMGDDVDKKKLTEPSKASTAAAALLNRQSNEDILTQELQRKNKYERLLRKAQNEDFSDLVNLRAMYQSGVDKFGRPVIVIVGRMVKIHQIDFNKALLYFINFLDPIVQKDYIIVYLHTLTTQENQIPLNVLKDVYNTLDLKYKRNLKGFYMVHPTFWSKVMTWWFTTFSASDIKNKLVNLGGIEYLYHFMHTDQLDIPQFVIEYDYKVNGARYYMPPSN